MASYSTATLLLASGVLCFTCVLACAYLVVTTLASCRVGNIIRHLAVAVTLVPVAFILCMVLVVSYNGLGDTLHTFAKEHQAELPRPLVYAAAAVRPLSGNTTLTDTMWMACLLFTAYGVANVWHHMIDIIRLLKASRRRLMLPEMRELRREEEAVAAAKAGKKR